jgi:hypothetical protein
VSIEIGDPGGQRFETVEALGDIGAYTLEGLRLAADPVGRRLIPVPGLLY